MPETHLNSQENSMKFHYFFHKISWKLTLPAVDSPKETPWNDTSSRWLARITCMRVTCIHVRRDHALCARQIFLEFGTLWSGFPSKIHRDIEHLTKQNPHFFQSKKWKKITKKIKISWSFLGKKACFLENFLKFCIYLTTKKSKKPKNFFKNAKKFCPRSRKNFL